MDLNPFSHCRKQYNVGLWQCPSFIFFILGIVNIASTLTTFFVTQKYTEEPEIAALIVIAVSVLILIISYIIVGTFAKLAETNKMKTEFLSVVSHQLLTPLNSEKWLINLLTGQKLGALNAEQIEYFNLLKSSNSKAIKLVADLLNVSRIEEKRMMFDRKPIDLARAAKEVVDDEMESARAAKVSLQFTDEIKAPIQILGDETKIKIVIQNFISNAIKYTKTNGQIMVILRKEDGRAKLSVIDNGVGIPKEEKPFIFQKFFRSSNVMRFQTIGSGIGLYISKYIIEMLGGKIGFESEEGKGSNFWFSLLINN